MPVLHYYTRKGCHLCEIALEKLLPLIQGQATVEIRDIDSCEEWRNAYDIRVPVIEFNGQLIAEYPFDHQAIVRFLADRPESTAEIGILRR